MTTMRVVGECFFWYRLTRVFPDKFHRAVKRLCCVCVCVWWDVKLCSILMVKYWPSTVAVLQILRTVNLTVLWRVNWHGVPCVGAVPGWREEAGYRRVQVQSDPLFTELWPAAPGVPGVQEHRPQRTRSVHPQRDVRRPRTWNAHHR